MQQMILTNTWTELQTPCSFQVKSGGRVAVCVEEVPSSNTPYFTVNVLDFWDHTDASLLYVKTIEASDTSEIVVTQI